MVVIGPLLMVETVDSFNTTLNIPFSLNCNVTAELDGKLLNTTIEWIRINGTSDMEDILESHECCPKALYFESSSGCKYDFRSGSGSSGSGSGFSGSPPAVFGYQSVLHRTENGTDSVVIYRCQATTMNITSYSDTTVYLEGYT